MAAAKQIKNEWEEPFHVFGQGEQKLRLQILKQVDDYRVDHEEWRKQAEQTDVFLDKLLNKIDEKAQLYSNEVALEKTILKQASARQGLKIDEPDEYDVIVPIIIKGLDIQTARVKDTDGQVMPGLERERVLNKDKVGSTHPLLSRADVFHTTKDGTVYLNSQNFYKKVWVKMLDKALADLKTEMPGFEFLRREHPPAVNIQVTYPDGNVVNFDIVPGRNTGSEHIKIPASVTGKKDTTVVFPSYALPKYDNKNNPKINQLDRELIWRQCTSAYERYMADLCRGSPPRQYVMTANRIMKSAIKMLQKEQNPLGNLINSYHLKTIAYHIIMDKTILDSNKIGGVKDALGFHITYLNMFVSKRVLPDFFHGNKHLGKIFPSSRILENHRELNLFWKSNPTLLETAIHGFKKLVKILEGCFTSSDDLK
ncbi:Hypothetical predicted protein [Mytilus galloprovincialis]|uniref:Mab-21-like nucleotidyltransferase domain-containing protein n=1 Tax=Mytilus galloprovincialis TaxID=29158 RepID=A0A8B6GA12_MYTGA|nr:Hypothetical predicted protein [Mytilus galloprovincialis]